MQPQGTSAAMSLGLGLTNDCDLACAHCYRETTQIDKLSLEQVATACTSLPFRSINLGTGENGLHAQFPEILDYLFSLQAKLSITSNGHSVKLLSDDQLRRFHSVEFSFDFATEAEQDAWRGAGNWALLMEQIERCQQLGPQVTITAVLMRTNFEKMVDLARLAGSLNSLLRVCVYQSVKTDAFSLSYEQFWPALRDLFVASRVLVCNEPIVRAVLGLKDASAGGCGKNTVRVTPSAKVLPCVYWPEEGLPLDALNSRQESVLETDLFRGVSALPEFCRACEFAQTCGGGCAGRRRLGGRLDQPDEYCPFVRGDTIDLVSDVGSNGDYPKAAAACTLIVDGSLR